MTAAITMTRETSSSHGGTTQARAHPLNLPPLMTLALLAGWALTLALAFGAGACSPYTGINESQSYAFETALKESGGDLTAESFPQENLGIGSSTLPAWQRVEVLRFQAPPAWPGWEPQRKPRPTSPNRWQQGLVQRSDHNLDGLVDHEFDQSEKGVERVKIDSDWDGFYDTYGAYRNGRYEADEGLYEPVPSYVLPAPLSASSE